jgi:aminodeoxyfutalosine deaminase
MPATDSPTSFIHALPKTELHLHLVGSASPETVLELARRHPDRGVPSTKAELRSFYEFTDFAHFIDVYAKIDGLVRSGEDVRALLLGLAREEAAGGVCYAEVTVTVGMHMQKGISASELVETLESARAQARTAYGIVLNWIFDVPAGFGERVMQNTVDFAVECRPVGTVALGLAGLEVGFPRARYAAAFSAARQAGLHAVVHAGETTGPEEVRAALDVLGAERIGHGIGSAADPTLLSRLARQGIVLEICPTSNLRTGAVTSATEHPLPALLAAGVPVTLSTDDPGMFDCGPEGEYALAAEWAGLDRPALAELARTGFRAAFCDEALREVALARIDALVRSSGR